jgi:hypothetical protein
MHGTLFLLANNASRAPGRQQQLELAGDACGPVRQHSAVSPTPPAQLQSTQSAPAYHRAHSSESARGGVASTCVGPAVAWGLRAGSPGTHDIRHHAALATAHCAGLPCLLTAT